MKTNIMCVLLVGGLTGAFFSCGEEHLTDRIDPNAPVPAQIDKNSVTVQNFPGRAVIHYSVPRDEHLLYVKAVYNPAEGVTREAKASLYVDSLVVEGFADAGEYPIRLYSVGRHEKESEPIVIPVSPGTPPVISAGETINMIATFGGIIGSFQNESRTPLIAVLLADTSHTGKWDQLRAFNLNSVQSSFSFINNMDTTDTDFRVYLKDRYGNMSPPVDFRLRPWFEEEIPKATWQKYVLPSDFYAATESEDRYGMEHLWDGIFTELNNYIYATTIGPEFPHHFTFKLGVTARISRAQIHHRVQDAYTGSQPKKVELWGSGSDAPSGDLFGGDWFLIGRHDSFMPSGSTGSPTQEDKDYATMEGERMLIQITDEIPDPYRPVKFIRVRTHEVWSGFSGGQVIYAELDLFGQIIK
jgi:hypothetical protein